MAAGEVWLARGKSDRAREGQPQQQQQQRRRRRRMEATSRWQEATRMRLPLLRTSGSRERDSDAAASTLLFPSPHMRLPSRSSTALAASRARLCVYMPSGHELCIAPRVLMQADSTLLLLPPSSMPLSPSLSPNLFHFAAAAAAAASSTAGAPTGAGVRLCASLSR